MNARPAPLKCRRAPGAPEIRSAPRNGPSVSPRNISTRTRTPINLPHIASGKSGAVQPARLHLQDREAVTLVMKRHPLDRAGERFTRWGNRSNGLQDLSPSQDARFLAYHMPSTGKAGRTNQNVANEP